jgi:nucleoside-diphosphate-sugar epimerase
MSNSIILVTGSSGLLGTALCHRFAGEGLTLIGFDQEGPPYPPPKTDCIFVDMTSDESVQYAMFMVAERYGKRLDSIFHLAAYYDFSGKESHLYDQVTVKGTMRLLRELRRFEVGQFIFSSSMLVHAPGKPGQKINESSPLFATWAYPESKIKTEKVIHEMHGNIPAVILRIAGVYTDWCQSIPIAHQIQRIYENDVTGHFYPGDLHTGQSFVHLDDVVEAFYLAFKKRADLRPYEVFLIGEPEAVPYEELQDVIGTLVYGKHWHTNKLPKPVAKAGAFVQEAVPGNHSFIKPWMVDRADDNYDLDIGKAQKTLGWQPKRSLRSSLPTIIDKLKSDPIDWYKKNKLSIPDWLIDQRQSA